MNNNTNEPRHHTAEGKCCFDCCSKMKRSPKAHLPGECICDNSNCSCHTAEVGEWREIVRLNCSIRPQSRYDADNLAQEATQAVELALAAAYEKGYDSGYDDGRAAGTEEGKEEHHDFYCPANIEHKLGEDTPIDYFLKGRKEGRAEGYAKGKEETIAECTSILNEASYDKGYAAAIAELKKLRKPILGKDQHGTELYKVGIGGMRYNQAIDDALAALDKLSQKE